MLLRSNQKVTRYVLLNAASAFGREGWRDDLRKNLEEMRFRDEGRVEVERSGFVDPWHLSTVTFSDHGRWLFEPYLVIGFRIDKRNLPKNLFDAELQKRVAAWCAEREVERAPNAVRAEFKDMLKDEWLRRVLPKVKHLQLTVDTRTGDAHLFGNVSECDSDQVRKAVFRLIGCRLMPWAQVRFPDEPGDALSRLMSHAAGLGPLRPSGGWSDDGGGDE